MTMGPVQLLVIGFDDPQFRGEILAEIERLRQDDVVRLIDMIVVKKTETASSRRSRRRMATLPGSSARSRGR